MLNLIIIGKANFGLLIDFPARRLYWSDLKLRTVSTVLLDGARLRREIRKLHPKEGKPFKIEVFESHVYLTTFQYNRVFKVDKFGRGGMTKVRLFMLNSFWFTLDRLSETILKLWDIAACLEVCHFAQIFMFSH